MYHILRFNCQRNSANRLIPSTKLVNKFQSFAFYLANNVHFYRPLQILLVIKLLLKGAHWPSGL